VGRSSQDAAHTKLAGNISYTHNTESVLAGARRTVSGHLVLRTGVKVDVHLLVIVYVTRKPINTPHRHIFTDAGRPRHQGGLMQGAHAPRGPSCRENPRGP